MASSPTVSAPWSAVSPKLGTAQEFQAVRSLFEECGYTSEKVCARCDVPTLDKHLTIRRDGPLPDPTDSLDALIRLFADTRSVSRDVLRRVLPPGALDALEALDLIMADPGDAAIVYAPCPVYPMRNLYIACDRSVGPDGVPWIGVADMVYPPVYWNTALFLDRLPQVPSDASLDIGTGSGIAALLLAPYARHVWAVDIASRSVHFAEFNRRLAGIENVTVLESDLYSAVEGMTFDVIVTHPPYVPSKRQKYVFREGGEDGEQILRAIVQQAPRYLREGGRFYCVVMGADREGESFEDRIRKWLGEDEREFDAVLVSDSLKTPAEHLTFAVAQDLVTEEDVQFLRDLWVSNNTEYIFRGPILLRRYSGGRPSVTARTQAGTHLRREDLEWLLEFESSIRAEGGLSRLLEARPKVSPTCEMIVRYREQSGTLAPAQFNFEAKDPFKVGCQVHEWMANTIAACDGTVTVREHFERLQAKNIVPPDAAPEQFARMLASLLASRILVE